jgi:hypothetical protein
MKKRNYYLIFFIIAFIGFAIYYQVHSSKRLKIDGRYTIATIDNIKATGNGLRVYISFSYKGIKKDKDYIEDVGKIKNLKISQRLFIKFDPSDFYGSIDFNSDCYVPDSIKAAPENGWSEEWMQEHFPNCVQ